MAEAVDESLSSLGNFSKQAIYFHLENAFKIKKQEIPCKIEDFADAIEQLFGVGAKLIELRIIEALHERTQDFVYLPKKGKLGVHGIRGKPAPLLKTANLMIQRACIAVVFTFLVDVLNRCFAAVFL